MRMPAADLVELVRMMDVLKLAAAEVACIGTPARAEPEAITVTCDEPRTPPADRTVIPPQLFRRNRHAR